MFEENSTKPNSLEQEDKPAELKQWFINEDDRLHKGNGFATELDDMFKLINYSKKHLSK
jgi:hypothetical protein